MDYAERGRIAESVPMAAEVAMRTGFERYWSPLPGTEAEAQGVADLHQQRVGQTELPVRRLKGERLPCEPGGAGAGGPACGGQREAPGDSKA